MIPNEADVPYGSKRHELIQRLANAIANINIDSVRGDINNVNIKLLDRVWDSNMSKWELSGREGQVYIQDLPIWNTPMFESGQRIIYSKYDNRRK